MNRVLAMAFLVLGTLLLLAGQWVAFEVYVNRKISQVNHNMAQFIHQLYSGQTLVRLDKADENVIILRTSTGKVIATNNAIGPLAVDNFIAASYSKDGNQAFVYTKRVGFSEYLNILIDRPFALGIALSGLILFIFGILSLLMESRKERENLQSTVNTNQEEIKKKLKALRVAFAMSGVIPKESLSEAKKILEDIIKKMEGKT